MTLLLEVGTTSSSSTLLGMPVIIYRRLILCRYVNNTIADGAAQELFYYDPRPRAAYKRWV